MASSASETDQLKATLAIRNKPFLVKLTSSEICWDSLCTNTPGAAASGTGYSQLFGSKPKKDTEGGRVRCSEVITVRLGCDLDSPVKGRFQHLEAIALDPTVFSIWFIERYQQHRWRPRHVSFRSRDGNVAQLWVERIQTLLSRPELKRPRSLLVFINPIGGRKKGPSIYQKVAAPLFELAGVTCDVVMTQRRNHARDILLEYDLTKVDGVVCVGGDGMLSELVHGLLARTLQEGGRTHPRPDDPLPRPHLRVGMIPAGSTDAVACSTNGTEDPMTAALHIILGDSVALDVGTVHQGDKFLRYNLSLLGYGYYGDCILESEATRWMGPRRYDWLGFKKLLNHRMYDGEVWYLPSAAGGSHPQDGTWCKAGCRVCQSPVSVQKVDKEQGQADTPAFAGGDTGDIGAITVNMRDPVTSGAGEWKVIRGRFLAINSFLMSCRCRLSASGPAPAAHLGDGCTDLVLIRQCSRAHFLQHLIRCTQKTDQFDLSFVDVFRVQAFQFRPLVEEYDDTHDASGCCSNGRQRLQTGAARNSVWNCDGEILGCSALQYRVHRQVLQMFARGIEDTERKDCPDRPGCVHASTDGKKT